MGDAAWSTLAESARRVAERMDNPYTSATSLSMLARVLMETMDRLRELAPAVEEADERDDLAARRAARRSAT